MVILLDNGHGGIIKGVYQTPGKRSPKWNDGSQLYEGEFNRAIVNGIIEELTKLKIKYVNVSPEYVDIPLVERVKRANAHANEACFYLSVHSNAGGGSGVEMYTSKGNTKSDAIATIFGQAFKTIFPDRLLRSDFSDGDLDKESNFYVLRKTKMPALLTENFFMDNEEECKTLLLTGEGRKQIIAYHVLGILNVIKKLDF